MLDNLVVKDVRELYYYIVVPKRYKLCFFYKLAINVKDRVIRYIYC
jgi:hypothetical protein